MQIIKNQNGFSIISAVVGVAVGLIGMMAISQIMIQNSSIQRYMSDGLIAEQHMRIYESVLSNPASCLESIVTGGTLTIAGEDSDNELTGRTIIHVPASGTARTILAANGEISPGVNFVELSLHTEFETESNATSRYFSGLLQYTFSRSGMGRDEIQRSHVLFYRADATGLVTHCAADSKNLKAAVGTVDDPDPVDPTDPTDPPDFGPGACPATSIDLGSPTYSVATLPSYLNVGGRYVNLDYAPILYNPPTATTLPGMTASFPAAPNGTRYRYHHDNVDSEGAIISSETTEASCVGGNWVFNTRN